MTKKHGKKTPAPAKAEPSILERRMAFARKHWRATGGAPFEIAKDGWLYREYWRPMHSFRGVAVDTARLCSSCAGLAGQLVEKYQRPGCPSKSSSCAGVCFEPIQFVILDLPRRSGKTVGTSGFIGALLFRGERETVRFISGSEDQSGMLFDEHYKAPIVDNPALEERARVTGTMVEVWPTSADKLTYDRMGTPLPRCRFEFASTSISGTTGGKNTVVVIDEARAVPADVFAALVPSTWDHNGWTCPTGARGHTQTEGDLDSPTRTECGVCGAVLEPYSGRVLAMSSAGEIDGGLKDWFFEWRDEALKGPGDKATFDERRAFARLHVYSERGAVINRKVASSSVSATAVLLGRVESLRDFSEIETSNTARRRGEDFLSHNDIAAVVDSSLHNAEAGERNGVGFLDTSDTTDLTSLVIVESDPRVESEEDPWASLVTVHVKIWEPKKSGARMTAEVLEDYLGNLVPNFRLVRLRVDDRHAPWVRNMVARLKNEPWGRSIVVGCSGKLTTKDAYSREDRRFAWKALEARVLGRTIRIPDHPILRRELKAARKKYDLDNNMDVRESGGRQRHLDVAEALAGCCFDVHAISTGIRRSTPADRRRGVDVKGELARLVLKGRSVTRGMGPNSF